MKIVAALLLGLTLALTGCAATSTAPGAAPPLSAKERATLEAGTIIEKVGLQFAQTYDLYNALYLAKKMPEEQYRRWVSWASDFQVSYALAHEAFKASKDAASAGEALDRVLKLKNDLIIFFVAAGGTQ